MKLSGRLDYWCVNESLNFTLATRIFFLAFDLTVSIEKSLQNDRM